jgi:hypothetical protein
MSFSTVFLAAQRSVKDQFRIGNIHEYMKERAMRGGTRAAGLGSTDATPSEDTSSESELAKSESLDHLVALVRRKQRQVQATAVQGSEGGVDPDEMDAPPFPGRPDHHVTEWYGGREGIWLVVDSDSGLPTVVESGVGQSPSTTPSPSPSTSQHWKYCYILETHCRLLPAGVSSNSKDYPVQQCCKMLEQNWSRLRPFLLPTMEYCPGDLGSGNPGVGTGDAQVQQVLPPSPPEAELVDSEGTTKPFQHIPQDYTLTFPEWINLRSDQSLMDRVHYSYNVLLHYLGWRMHNQETGELDRHAYWRERYQILESELLTRYSSGPATTASSGIGGYTLIIPILRTLIEFRLTVFAKNLLRFVLEEMLKGRLLFLREVWTSVWVPYLQEVVEERPDLQERIQHDCQRMLRRAAKIGHDDSDSD